MDKGSEMIITFNVEVLTHQFSDVSIAKRESNLRYNTINRGNGKESIYDTTPLGTSDFVSPVATTKD